MKMHFEFTASEMMSLNNLGMLFNEQLPTTKSSLRTYCEGQYEEVSEFKADGSYSCDYSVNERFMISCIGLITNIASQCKGLIMACIDTYKNIVKSFAPKKLFVDGKEVTCARNVSTRVHIHDIDIKISGHFPYDIPEEDAKKQLEQKVVKAFADEQSSVEVIRGKRESTEPANENSEPTNE